MSIVETPKPALSFEEAFNQAINSLDLKGTITLSNLLTQRALFLIDQQDKHKAKVNHILTN